MQRFHASRLAAILVFCLCAFAQTAFSQATLSVQGVIKNSDGTAVDNGKYSLTFRLYASESGGSPVWSETQDNVQVTGGIYSALLGASTPMTAAFNTTYYLGLSVEGGAELIPRAKLTSSPYALSLIGTGNIFPSSGAIGAGTATPSSGYQLHVHSSGMAKLYVEGTGGSKIDFNQGSDGSSAQFGFYGGDNVFRLNPASSATQFYYGGNERLTINSGGVSVSGTMSMGTANATTTNVTTANITTANVTTLAASNSVTATNEFITGSTGGAYTRLTNNHLAARNGGSSATLYLNNDGGKVEMGGALYVRGYLPSYTINTGTRYINAGEQGYSTFSSTSTGIKSDGLIDAGGFYAQSDRRIKTNFAPSMGGSDLGLLNRLQVTDYQYIDKVQHGARAVKGFVAQEVETVLPQAVKLNTAFVPSLFARPVAVQRNGQSLRVDMGKAHGLKAGDKVRIYTPDNQPHDLTVAERNSETAFVVRDWDATATTENLFVYGQEVSDFHAVDFNQLTALNISATQELARQVEDLKKENAALKAENGQMKTEMKASAEKMEARLRALENRISN